MKGTAYIYKVDGTIEKVDLDKPPELELLKKAVGGYIELVPGLNKIKRTPCVAFCNEEGKLQGLPLNIKATELWANSGAFKHILSDVLCGDVIVITGDEELMRSL